LTLLDTLILYVTYLLNYLLTDGWFGVVVMALVTSTKLSYVEPG